MAKPNTALRLAIWEKRLRQKQIARRAKMHQSDVSLIVNGKRPASEDEQKRIAAVLDMPVSALFQQVAS